LESQSRSSREPRTVDSNRQPDRILLSASGNPDACLPVRGDVTTPETEIRTWLEVRPPEWRCLYPGSCLPSCAREVAAGMAKWSPRSHLDLEPGPAQNNRGRTEAQSRARTTNLGNCTVSNPGSEYMSTSPRVFVHVYAIITGALLGIVIWAISLHVRSPEPPATPVATTCEIRPVAFVTVRQWYLEKLPNKDNDPQQS
jgi:hypothetical protein